MTSVDPAALDLATLAYLAGVAANERLLGWIHEAGHPRVRTSHGYVFQHLLECTPTVGELAALLGVTQQGASKVVAELEALGYVERRPEAGDSRVRRVALTSLGHRVIECGRAARVRFERRLRAKVGAPTMRAAGRALVALLEASGGLDAVASRRARPLKT